MCVCVCVGVCEGVCVCVKERKREIDAYVIVSLLDYV